MADQPTPASPFDSEFESWLHTALLGGAPMRGTNLPADIVKALQNLAANENATSDDQQTLRESWAQHKRDEAARRSSRHATPPLRSRLPPPRRRLTPSPRRGRTTTTTRCSRTTPPRSTRPPSPTPPRSADERC
jgi:hypothetical protein